MSGNLCCVVSIVHHSFDVIFLIKTPADELESCSVSACIHRKHYDAAENILQSNRNESGADHIFLMDWKANSASLVHQCGQDDDSSSAS